MRLTKQQIEQIKSYVGKTQNEIALLMGIKQGLVSYWRGNGQREKRIQKAKERFKNLSPEQKKKIYESRKDYIREYCKKRYNEDEIYRYKQRVRAKIWKRMKQKKD